MFFIKKITSLCSKIFIYFILATDSSKSGKQGRNSTEFERGTQIINKLTKILELLEISLTFGVIKLLYDINQARNKEN